MNFVDIGDGLTRVDMKLQKGTTIYCESIKQRVEVAELLNNKGYKTQCLISEGGSEFGLYIKRDDEI